MILPRKTIPAQTNVAISRFLHFRGANYSKCLNFWRLSLVPPWPRITLFEHQEICSTSHLRIPRGPPPNTCASMGNLKIRSENSSHEQVVRSFSRNFLEASRSIFCHPFDVFWCPGGPRTIPEWSWIDFGNFIFRQKILKKSASRERLCHFRTTPRINRFECSHVESALKYSKLLFKNTSSPNEYIDFSKSNFWWANLFKMSL